MLVAISGSQGSGKTTVLNELAKSGGSYNFVTRKTSRSIQSEWGRTLDEINNDTQLTLKFQDEILKRKFQDEMATLDEAKDKWSVTITERTYADLFTYALFALGQDRTTNEWLTEYYSQCIKYQQQYDYVFYLRAGHFNISADLNRANHNSHYSRATDLVMQDITQQMTMGHRLNIIDTPDLDQRVEIISTHVMALVMGN